MDSAPPTLQNTTTTEQTIDSVYILKEDEYNRTRMYMETKRNKDGTIKPSIEQLKYIFGQGTSNYNHHFYVSYIGSKLTTSKKIHLNVEPSKFKKQNSHSNRYYETWDPHVWQFLLHAPVSLRPRTESEDGYAYEFVSNKTVDIKKLHKLEDELNKKTSGKYIVYLYLYDNKVHVYSKEITRNIPYPYEPKYDKDGKFVFNKNIKKKLESEMKMRKALFKSINDLNLSK